MKTRITRSQMLLASAVAGALTIASQALPAPAHAEGEKVKCYGVNECKGHGACAGPNGCAGKNACKGQGFVEVESKDACLKMEGGRLTPQK